jgi:hypothetical protein
MYDPAEADPHVLGDIELLDMETNLLKKVTINEKNLRQYKELFAQFLESVKTYTRSYGLGCAQTVTRVPFDELILRMMRVAGSVG